MTTPSYAELTASIRREGQAIIAAAQLGLDVPVPTCGDWQLPDLLVHVASVYRRAAKVVEERATAKVDFIPIEEPVSDPVGQLEDMLDELVHALSDVDADTEMWNWSPGPQVAAFWARRMAHESAVHRYDAQRAHAVAQPIEADLAPDGLDEIIDVIVPRLIDDRGVTLPEGVISLVGTDDGGWCFRTWATGIERLDVTKDPDVTVRGTASALLLAMYNRVKWTSLDTSGDTDVLDAWSAAVKF